MNVNQTIVGNGNTQVAGQAGGVIVRHEEVEVFGSSVLVAITGDNKEYFSPRHMCEGMGIAWNSQYTKIKSDQMLDDSVIEFITETPGSKRGARKQLLMPLNMLSGWLMTLKPKMCKPELRPTIERYRKEAYAVLDAWFRKNERASNPQMQEAVGASLEGILANPANAAKVLTALAEEREAKEIAEAKVLELDAENNELSQDNMRLETRKTALEHKVKEDAPKVVTYERTMSAKGNVNLRTAMKNLNVRPNLGITRLRDRGFLYKVGNENLPIQHWQNKGLFEVKIITRGEHDDFISYQTLMTPKGIDYFAQRRDALFGDILACHSQEVA